MILWITETKITKFQFSRPQIYIQGLNSEEEIKLGRKLSKILVEIDVRHKEGHFYICETSQSEAKKRPFKNLTRSNSGLMDAQIYDKFCMITSPGRKFTLLFTTSPEYIYTVLTGLGGSGSFISVLGSSVPFSLCFALILSCSPFLTWTVSGRFPTSVGSLACNDNWFSGEKNSEG